jgi:broad specificity phosphatase PhoE
VAPDEQRLLQLSNAPEPRAGLLALTDPGGVTEVLLIRHGHIDVPPGNQQDDGPLTDIGREQAEVLADYLASHKPLDAVISSPFRRTLETAEPIAARQLLKVDVDPNLREIGLKIPPESSLREVMGEVAWEAMRQRLVKERRWDVRGEFGETGASIRERAVAAVERAVSLYTGGRVALVTHGPVINAYLAQILESPFDMLLQPKVTSVTIIWAKDEKRDVKVVASTAHFGTF